jgi:hypothetical protein
MAVGFRAVSGLYLIKVLRILYKARTAGTFKGHGMLNVPRHLSETCTYVCMLSIDQAPGDLKLIQRH